MQVSVESTLSGVTSGRLSLHCLSGLQTTIYDIIHTYCEKKGVYHRPEYVLRTHKFDTLPHKKTLAELQIKEGTVLFLGCDDDEEDVLAFGKWWLLTIICFIIGGGGIMAVCAIYLLTQPPTYSYGVVFDSGSYHTGMSVFQWSAAQPSNFDAIKTIASCSSEGGLDGLLHNISGVEDYLSPCLDVASTAVPASSHASTPVYFAATAGLRVANLTSPPEVSALLDEVYRVLDTELNMVTSRDQVGIIPGAEEGSDGWIAVNLLKDSITADESRSTFTFGSLDLGGASTEIAFETAASSPWVDDITLYGSDYTVYSRSYLCYGVDMAYLRYLTNLIQDPAVITVYDPCGPKQNVTKKTGAMLFGNACTTTKRFNISEGTEYSFIGLGDEEACLHQVRDLFNLTTCQANYEFDECFNTELMPTAANTSFIAISTFPYIFEDLNLTDMTSLDNYRQKVKAMCSAPWEEILDMVYGDEDVAFMFCFESVFVDVLLGQYGFTGDTWGRMEAVFKINGTEVDWTLGYIVEAIKGLPPTAEDPYITSAVLVILLVGFVLFVLVGLFFLYHWCRLRKAGSASYQRKLADRLDSSVHRFY